MKKNIYILLIILIIIVGCGKTIEEKELVCTKDITTSNIPMFQTININYIEGMVDVINSNTLVTLPTEYKSSIDKFIDSFDKQYKEQYGEINSAKIEISKKSDTEIYINLLLDYKEMSEEEKETANVVGSNQYSDNKLQLEKKGYTCK